MRKYIFIIIHFFFFGLSTYCQPDFNANTTLPINKNTFEYGTNMGYYRGYNSNNTSDILIADLVKATGLNTIRLALYDDFLTRYGADIRQTEFDYYANNLHFNNLTLFLNDPYPSHQEIDTLTCVHKSTGKVERFRNQVFRNLYTPIWDMGKNGTPVNDTNYFAAYVYAVVKDYGSHIKFHEVWNEPDFAANNNCTLASGLEGNWLDNNPAPCDLVNLRAEITTYIRMLRITYEIVKTYYPDSYVATGGIGYPNFLDAVLRNTDNPDQGKVTVEFPFKGGAWFDVLSYHSYPQYAMQYWNSTLRKFIYSRHSDKAVSAVFDLRNKMRAVLYKYNYDGKTFPLKPFIITEINVPRKTYPNYDFIGSPEIQTNTLMKTYILAQKENIFQVYSYTIGDNQDENLSVGSQQGMDLMGYYYNLNKATPTTAMLTPSGVGVKGLTQFLYGYKYDNAKTQLLNLSADVDGAVFSNDKKVKCVLWAKTQVDSSEYSSANFTLPSSFVSDSLVVKRWNYIQTSQYKIVKNNIVKLEGSPSLIELLGNVSVSHKMNTAQLLKIYPNPSRNEFYISLNESGTYSGNLYNLQGAKVFSFSGKGLLNKQKIQTPILSKGMYMLDFQINGKKVTEKLIVN